MSAFSTSPRPRIVNGVLIRECSDKERYNGLQGTNSKEDFYRALTEMPPPTPEPELVSAECDFNPQENCPNLENPNGPAHFDHERRSLSGHSETHSAHCDHRQAFEAEKYKQQTPSFCTHSNNHNCLTAEKLNMGQDSLDSHSCSEGKNLRRRDEWESGDHHRSMVDYSPALNEAGRHYSPDNCCCNTPVLLNKDQPKCLHKGSSSQSVRRGSSLEECQENTHHHTCTNTHDAVLTEDKPILRGPSSRRLHEQEVDSSHGETDNCNVLMTSEDSCCPQNAIREPSLRGRNRTTRHEKSEDLIHTHPHPHSPSPNHLNTKTQECRPQDEQLEYNQATAREEFDLTEGHPEDFAGYPPQRRIGHKQHNTPPEDENVSHHGSLNRKALRNKKPECRRFIRRKSQIGSVTELEARSVAEIMNHPVVDVHPVESEVLDSQGAPTLRTLIPEEGYPPQPVRKPKHSVYGACEDDSQNEETHFNYSAQKGQITRHNDYSKLNDSCTRAESEHDNAYIYQRSNVRCGNEYEGCDEYCRACSKTSFRRPHMTENGHEETFAYGSEQDTACVNQEQYNNICMEHSPRTFHPEAQEQHYHSLHSSNTPGEETNNFSVKNRSKEAKCRAPVSCESRESHFHNRDQILNEVNSRRKNKDLYRGRTTNSCRPTSACDEDESYRTENEILVHTAEGQCIENPISSYVEHSGGENGHSLQDTAPHDELPAGEREKCFAQSTNIPARPCDYCEAEHAGDNPRPAISELNSKPTEEGLEKYSAAPPCEVDNVDDNIVPCSTDPPCNPDGSSLGPSGLNERCLTKSYRRYNGLEDEDNVIRNTERDDSFEGVEENNKSVTRKHRMQILQNARQNAVSHSKSETLAKLNHPHSITGASEVRKHPSNLTSKTRIPKMKPSVHLTSNKNSTAAGCPQRSKRTSGPKL